MSKDTLLAVPLTRREPPLEEQVGAAVRAGARQVQGTLNGLGERCGNANLTSIIPTLLLKSGYAERY